MDQFGHNPFSPGMKSGVFIPDQLISGPLQVVTDSVTIGVSGVIRCGTVLGIDATWNIADLKAAFRPLAIFLRDSIQSPVS